MSNNTLFDVTDAASFVSTHGTTILHLEKFADDSAVLIMEDTIHDRKQRMALSASELRVLRDTLTNITS